MGGKMRTDAAAASPARQKEVDKEALRREFNLWAERGKGASMERHHAPLAERVIARMGLAHGDHVLDVGCGSGWTARRIAQEVGDRGLVVGVDISDAMIREAELAPANPANVRFLCAAADRIPGDADFYSHAVSIESFYYYPDQRAVLHELRRLLAPGGRLFLLMCLYRGHPHAEEWRGQLAVPVHVRTPEEYVELLHAAGWAEPRYELFAPDPAEAEPDPHGYALLVEAHKPVSPVLM